MMYCPPTKKIYDLDSKVQWLPCNHTLGTRQLVCIKWHFLPETSIYFCFPAKNAHRGQWLQLNKSIVCLMTTAPPKKCKIMSVMWWLIYDVILGSITILNPGLLVAIPWICAWLGASQCGFICCLYSGSWLLEYGKGDLSGCNIKVNHSTSELKQQFCKASIAM